MLRKTQYVKDVKWQELSETLASLTYEKRRERFPNVYSTFNKIDIVDKDVRAKIHRSDFILFPDSPGWYNRMEEKEQLEKLAETDRGNIAKVRRGVEHYLDFNINIDAIYYDESYVVFKYSTFDYVILPKEFVVLEEAPNYDALSYSEMQKMIAGNLSNSENALTTEVNTNYSAANSAYEKAKQELELAEEKAKQELEAFKQEMYKQEQALKAKQEAMLAELRGIKEKFEDQIFLLEMNIFALRSFFGETYCMMQIKKGKNAPEDQVLQIYQKFRYLDEEFARLAGLTPFDRTQYAIKDVFAKNKELLDTFCPSNKCITFFKVSKENVAYAYDRENDCLEMFKFYHGNQIGMLIRNGENVYLSFIDEEVTLKDNLFVSEGSAQEETAITQDTKIRDKEARPLFNRKLIFIILQQIVSNTNIFSELKGEQIFVSDKIRLTDADRQICTYKYPSFSDCFHNKCDVSLEDEIFITSNHAGSKITGSYGYGSAYEEHRSYGYANRGRDASIEYGVGKINLIDKKFRGYFKEQEDAFGYIVNKEIEMTEEEFLKNTDPKITKRYSYRYFVSCKRNIYDFQKTVRWDGTYAKVNNVNLEIYREEFMSIMWINSNYPKEWIDAKHIGSWKEGNYSYLVSKLKELKEHLEEREKEESKLLSRYLSNVQSALGEGFIYTAEMKDQLLEWRKANRVRKLTDFQAKRFAKYFNVLHNAGIISIQKRKEIN